MSEKLPRIDCQDLIRALERAGFVRKRQKGSCRMPRYCSGDDERAANTSFRAQMRDLPFYEKALSSEYMGLALVEAARCFGGFCAVKKPLSGTMSCRVTTNN